VLLVLCAGVLVKEIMLHEPHRAPLLAFSDTTNVLVALMITPWALYTTSQKADSTDRMIGDLSYIFYLLHWSVLGALKTGEGSYIDRLVLCSEALVLIFAVSYLIWSQFDRPINRWRSAWVSQRRLLRSAVAPEVDMIGVMRSAKPVL
jgi:peptidoglycan/LPS O-acetylase OafA/YrhL